MGALKTYRFLDPTPDLLSQTLGGAAGTKGVGDSEADSQVSHGKTPQLLSQEWPAGYDQRDMCEHFRGRSVNLCDSR